MHGARTHPRPRWPRRAQHPGTHIALQEALSDTAARAAASGAADLGIFGENTAAFGLVTSVCDVHDLVLLVPQKHPLAERDGVSFAEALQFDFIGQERESSLVRLMAAAGPSPSPLRCTRFGSTSPGCAGACWWAAGTARCRPRHRPCSRQSPSSAGG